MPDIHIHVVLKDVSDEFAQRFVALLKEGKAEVLASQEDELFPDREMDYRWYLEEFGVDAVTARRLANSRVTPGLLYNLYRAGQPYNTEVRMLGGRSAAIVTSAIRRRLDLALRRTDRPL